MTNQKKSILFIGAGASYGARQDWEVAPPLGAQLLAFLRKNAPILREEIWKSQFPHAVGYIDSAVGILEREGSENNIENLLARLSPTERGQLHRLLQIVFCDLSSVGISVQTGFEMAKDGYDDLVDALGIGSQQWNIVSLNYDLLLENALERRCITFRYNTLNFGDSRDSAKLEVYKPHGSINFFSQGDHRFGYGGPAPEPGEPIRSHDRSDGSYGVNFPITYACNLHPLDVAHRAANSLCHPILATYAPRKDADINENVLQEIRKKAIAEAQACDALFMIGVNPVTDPKDDPFCSELLSLPFKQVVYVGKGVDSVQSMERIYPNVEVHYDGLSTFIEGLRNKKK